MRTSVTSTLLLLAMACSGDTPVVDTTDTDTTDTTAPTSGDTGNTATDTTDGTTDTETDTTKPTGDTGPVDCADVELSGMPPLLWQGGTVDEADNQSSTICGKADGFATDVDGAGLEDIVFRYTAPKAGLYAFDLTDRTRMDAIIYQRTACDGSEIACVNATEFGNEVIVVDLDLGESTLIVVDGGRSYVEMRVEEAAASEMQCLDTEDDDFDRLTDCLDPDCYASNDCVEICDNFKDDNDTGLVDCEDPICFPDAACFEDCDNGIDDNKDGVFDCNDDLQCADDKACASTCPDLAPASTLPQTFMGDTLGNVDDASLSCGGALSGDVQIEYIATVTADHVIDTVGSDYDTAVSVTDGCGGKELACNDDAIGANSQVVVSMVKGTSYTINVDGAGGSEGNFVVNVGALEKTESVCTDGRDLDNDGAVDCDDKDCAADKACADDPKKPTL